MLQRGGVGAGREDQEGGDICVHTAASHCCTVGTNTTLESSYALIFFLRISNSFSTTDLPLFFLCSKD